MNGPDDEQEFEDDSGDGGLYDDELEEALDDCRGYWDGATFGCMGEGSEECDNCPFNEDIGKSRKEIQELAGLEDEDEEDDGDESSHPLDLN